MGRLSASIVSATFITAVLNLVIFVAPYDTCSSNNCTSYKCKNNCSYNDTTTVTDSVIVTILLSEEVTHPNTTQYTSAFITEAGRVIAACNTERANIAAGVVGGFAGGLVLGIVLTALFTAILILITKQYHKKGNISRYNVMHYRYHNIILNSCFCVHACIGWSQGII